MAFDQLLAELHHGDIARYVPHTLDLKVDIDHLRDALSERADDFVDLFIKRGREVSNDQKKLAQIYGTRWTKVPRAIKAFDNLSEDEKCEVLTFFTIPLHEFRHHVDLLTTPLGVHFHVHCVQEYLHFQSFSPALVMELPFVPGGRLKSLDEHLKRHDLKLNPPYVERWDKLAHSLRLSEAWGDLNNLTVGQGRIERGWYGTPLVYHVCGKSFKGVTVNGVFPTLSPAERPDWYIRPSTILEARAVIVALLWILDQIEEKPGIGADAAALMRVLYQDEGKDDYRLLLDLVAGLVDAETIVDALENRPAGLVRNALQLADYAAWYALHAGPPRLDGWRTGEIMAIRLCYALANLSRKASQGVQIEPLSFLAHLDGRDHAVKLGIEPVEPVLERCIELVGKTVPDTVYSLWQEQVRRHFEHVMVVLESQLKQRLGFGYWSPLASSADGNILTKLGSEQAELFTPYKPGPWASDWFEFRRRSFFSPDLVSSVSKRLRAQFGIDMITVNCECGALNDVPVPRWRKRHSFNCQQCGKSYYLEDGELTKIYVDLTAEEEAMLERLVEKLQGT